MPKAPSKSASNADLEFWHEPYNPIYNLVKARPVLVHQYACHRQIKDLQSARVLTISDVTITTATSSSSGLISDLCCSTTMIPMLETIARPSGVSSYN